MFHKSMDLIISSILNNNNNNNNLKFYIYLVINLIDWRFSNLAPSKIIWEFFDVKLQEQTTRDV